MGEIYDNYVNRLLEEIELKASEGSMIISDPDIWILSAWFADEGLSLRDQDEFLSTIDQMQQQDPEMYASLKRGNVARMSGIKYEKAWTILKAREQLSNEIEKGMADVRAGRTCTFEELMAEIDSLIQEGKGRNHE